MSKTVLICGSDGYIGHSLTLRLLKKGYKVIGIDDFRRRFFVEHEMGSFSAIPIEHPKERILKMKEFGDYDSFEINIEGYDSYDLLKEIIKKFEPETIVNLAQQPSAPFSHKSRKNSYETTFGNVLGTLNIIHAIEETNPNIHYISIGSMGEYDPSVGIRIPEGFFDFEYVGKTIKNVIYPRRPGSYYHCSKVASTYFIDCACRFYGLKATDIMQGVVYGAWTPEIEETGLNTRLDTDESFGTAFNRFIVQAIIGHPLTIFGKGDHSRGFISLTDAVQCLILAIENKPNDGEYRTWNQLDEVYSINNLADEVIDIADKFGIKARKIHIETPRSESTDGFYYNPVVDKLKNLGFKSTRTIKDESVYIIENLKDLDLSKLHSVVIPHIKWGK
jgi:nucleoside-diphosphate-sugar epimerase